MPTEIKDFNKLAFLEWLKEHEAIRPLAEKCPIWFRYRIIAVPICEGYIYSYNENGTITLTIDKSSPNDFLVPRNVFGLRPESIEAI